MFDHFGTLCIKGEKENFIYYAVNYESIPAVAIQSPSLYMLVHWQNKTLSSFILNRVGASLLLRDLYYMKLRLQTDSKISWRMTQTYSNCWAILFTSSTSAEATVLKHFIDSMNSACCVNFICWHYKNSLFFPFLLFRMSHLHQQSSEKEKLWLNVLYKIIYIRLANFTWVCFKTLLNLLAKRSDTSSVQPHE